ncbi:hypothetical protein JTE90_007758 [Oedothorax gibbosus]|uniref:Uncharacterized protein n=1 Tax=Oedothorax gibbosus TaxID=931172 RepID=A0AAV6UDS4_9ARAC|nr:hypothetical protein JTE90_007758 [Oedothorax gibbosus]
MQPQFVLVLVLVSAFCVSHVNCQSGDGDGLWSKLRSMISDFMKSLRGIWDELKSEIKSRTGDMTSWTREMLDSFKIKMKEWVDQISGAPDSEKEDMRKYIERLQLPNEQ